MGGRLPFEKRGDGRSSTDGKLLAKAVTIDGRKDWYCRFCSETNVWTRSKRRRCQTNILSVLQGTHMQGVSTKSGRSWSESSHQVRVGQRVGHSRPSGLNRQSCTNCVVLSGILRKMAVPRKTFFATFMDDVVRTLFLEARAVLGVLTVMQNLNATPITDSQSFLLPHHVALEEE